jgi:hypothetical protein
LLFLSSLIFNTVLSLIVFFAFGGRDLMNRRIDTEPEATARFRRETADSGAPTIAGGAVDIAAEPPELNRDRALTLLGIAALVALALMPGIDWDVGFVAVSIAVVFSLAMPHATKNACADPARRPVSFPGGDRRRRRDHRALHRVPRSWTRARSRPPAR